MKNLSVLLPISTRITQTSRALDQEVKSTHSNDQLSETTKIVMFSRVAKNSMTKFLKFNKKSNNSRRKKEN